MSIFSKLLIGVCAVVAVILSVYFHSNSQLQIIFKMDEDYMVLCDETHCFNAPRVDYQGGDDPKLEMDRVTVDLRNNTKEDDITISYHE